MGAHSTSFIKDNDAELAEYATHPSKPDWIVSHAVTSGLAIVEVERLWHRFQQLGCNEDGVLEMEALTRPPASNDIFVKNILLNLVNSYDVITFMSFLNIMCWAEYATLDDKIDAAFNLINLGRPVTKALLLQILRKTYENESYEEIGRLADSLMDEIDEKKLGSFNLEQFRWWVHRLPQSTVAEIFQFVVIPRELTKQIDDSIPSLTDPRLTGIPTDDVLRMVAAKAQTRPWHVLGNKLGFSEHEIHEFELKNRSDVKRQIYDMLRVWRTVEGQNALTTVLQRALHDAGMNDIAQAIYTSG